MAGLPSRSLFLLAADADVEADYAVLIAGANHRNATREKIFALDDLLRTLGNIGAVGERDVVGELLLDGDLRAARGRIGLGGQALGIDLDPADAEKFLHTAARGGVDRLIDDHGRCLIGEGRSTGLLLQLLGVFAGAAGRYQRDNVRLWQSALGGVVYRH